MSAREKSLGSGLGGEGRGEPAGRRRGEVAFVALLVGLAAVGACLSGTTRRPVGGLCTDDRGCAAGLQCEYGRCRQPCAFDRDCPAGATCVAAEDGEGRVCYLPPEGQADGGLCAPGLDVGPDGLCHELCAPSGDRCDEGYVCVDGVCVEGEAPADGDADGDADEEADADADVDGEADRDEPRDAEPDGRADADDGATDEACFDLGPSLSGPATVVRCGGITGSDTIDRPGLVRELLGSVSLGDLTAPAGGAVDTGACRADFLDDVPEGCVLSIGGVELCVVAVEGLTVPAGVTLFVTGARPLVVVSRGDLVVGGHIDASARGETPGPSGRAPTDATDTICRGAAGALGPPIGGGGGGGLHATGGAGGCATGGAGGSDCSPCGTYAFEGGWPGGDGAGSDSSLAGTGGGGGGAVYLLSLSRIDIPNGGAVLAEGGAGRDGTMGGGSSGAGGGSGGVVVLEAPTVWVAGTVSTVGGPGGTAEASDGTAMAGGAGGGGAVCDGDAGVCDPDATMGSGGGGSGGRVLIRASTRTLTGATIYPDPAPCSMFPTGC